MKKAKLIDVITGKCGGILSDVLDRKKARILRAVEQAKADALDNASDCNEQAADIIKSFGDVADSKSTPELQTAINNYLEKVQDAHDWEAAAGYLEELKNKLQEEVDVEE